MEERIRHRHAELVAARQAHHAHLAQLRAALATAMVPFLIGAILISYFGLQRRAWQQGADR